MKKVQKSRKDAAEASHLTVSRPELLIDGHDDAFRQYIHDTLAFAARIQEIRNALGTVIGLSGSQYLILIAIAHEQNQHGVGVNSIAEHLHLSASFVTIEVKKLVEAKLVSKRDNLQDRRRVLLSITPKGEALLQELTTVQRPVNDALFEPLSAEDFAQLRKKTAELVGSADRALKLISFLAKP